MKTHIKKKTVGFCVLLLLAVTITAINIWQNNRYRAIATTLTNKADVATDTGHISFKGKNYRRKSYVKAILVLGIDSNVDMYYIQDAGSGGQADGIGLIAWDTNSNNHTERHYDGNSGYRCEWRYYRKDPTTYHNGICIWRRE